MDTLVKMLCVVSLVWIAGFSEHPQCTGYGTGPPDTGHPSDPNPRNGSMDVPIEPVISWHMNSEMGDDDFTYDIYFGTGEDLKNPPLVTENLDSNEYHTGTLNYETTYSWRVVATERGAYSPGDHRVSEGPLWSFTTYDGVILEEGFEGEFPPPEWRDGNAWDSSAQGHTGESSARGTMGYVSGTANLYSPEFNSYNDSSGSIDFSFYYKPEFADRIPRLEFYIKIGAPTIYLFSGWVDNEDWELAEYTISRSDLGNKFQLVFRTYYEEPVGEDTCVLIDDVLVKDSALK